ncbi:hypothetical protein F383_10831 [Gossypium arboreum]|uniref:Uncharacterized protein n=1 Tax=Gossypium arboreum TaxID=29729 RepID=A0A0B0MF30_GOSAR|nr:hypothetical protein F383_37459 [Gossypium arboreum]KHG19080.1 hypothetical protein F383_24420 [Gossypium arboreum]KHG28645.1 hypothetical protein F383_35017 [Gossypium arboreum]KHG29580.1 hypothetical protein F383_10831 [Gossypium arboreum]
MKVRSVRGASTGAVLAYRGAGVAAEGYEGWGCCGASRDC